MQTINVMHLHRLSISEADKRDSNAFRIDRFDRVGLCFLLLITRRTESDPPHSAESREGYLTHSRFYYCATHIP